MTDFEEDEEMEEILSDISEEPLNVSDVRNYFGEDDGEGPTDHLNVEKSKETSTCWPNQKASADNILQRIVFILKQQGRSLSYYKSFDFQVRNICIVGTLFEIFIFCPKI